MAAFLNAVFLLGVPRWRPPRRSPGFDPLADRHFGEFPVSTASPKLIRFDFAF